jgi:hypothetical protein
MKWAGNPLWISILHSCGLITRSRVFSWLTIVKYDTWFYSLRYSILWTIVNIPSSHGLPLLKPFWISSKTHFKIVWNLLVIMVEYILRPEANRFMALLFEQFERSPLLNISFAVAVNHSAAILHSSQHILKKCTSLSSSNAPSYLKSFLFSPSTSGYFQLGKLFDYFLALHM